MKKKLFAAIALACVSVVVFLATSVPSASAEGITSIGIANYLSIQADKVEDGSIVVATPQGYTLSTTPYDSKVVGVVSLKPAVSLKTANDSKTYPVVNFGTVNVKVTGTNGNIKKGDPIATSEVRATAMKAVKAGYVLGEALEDLTFSKSNEVKLLKISMNLHFYQAGNNVTSSLFDILSLSQIATYEQPLRVLQYIVAGIIVLASFVFGFLIFGKTVNTGIEALGRNPLAGRMIQLSIVFNVVLIIVIIMAGITLSYILIRL